ncbi:unnamed protein product, partial [Durusdinium trenchii]
MRLLDLMKKCEKIDAAPVVVPSDGNCLIWSLLVLHDQNIQREWTSLESINLQVQLRQTLRKLWLNKRGDDAWQEVFKFAVERFFEETTATPPQKAKKELGSEHPSPFSAKKDGNGKRKVRRVDAARPVDSMVLKDFSDTKLKAPPNKAESALEPPIPDLAESLVEGPFHDNMMLVPHPVEDDDSEMEAELDHRRRKRKHRRTCKKRVQSQREMQDKMVGQWLAEHGLAYASWLKAHRLGSTYRKIGQCYGGGWMNMKLLLAQKKDITCPVCLSTLTANGIDVSKVPDLSDEPAQTLEADAMDIDKDDAQEPPLAENPRPKRKRRDTSKE